MGRALVQDCRYAIRSLQRTRGFSWVAIVVLALGIAANTVVFSVVNAVLLRPLPYPDSNQLVILHWNEKEQLRSDVSAAAFFVVKDHATSLKSVSAIYPLAIGVNLAGGSAPQYVKALRVSSDFLTTLGVPPVIGRNFLSQDDIPNTPCTALISYGLWDRLFNKTAGVIGRPVHVNGSPCSVIGVMPAGFRSYPEAELWLALQLSPGTADPGSDYRVIGRVGNNLSFQQAEEEIGTLSEKYHLTYMSASSKDARLTLQPLRTFEAGDTGSHLKFLFGAVVLLLVIACTNLAALFLVRASLRRREIAIRTALGSPWTRIARISLLESTFLAALAGLFGIILAKEGLPFVLSLAPDALPMKSEVIIDFHVVVFTVAISAFTSILFGLAPVFHVLGGGIDKILRQSTRASSSVEQSKRSALLISAQAFLTLILLTGALLLLNDFRSLVNLAPGFDSNQVFVAQISLAAPKFRDSGVAAESVEQITALLKADSNIEAVATINGLPLEHGLNLPIVPSESTDKIEHASEYRIVSEDYFSVLRIPVLMGRPFQATDSASSSKVVIINETLAHKWWPDTTPIGHFVKIGGELGEQFSDAPRQIVGVAADVHESGLDRPAHPSVFVPVAQVPEGVNQFVNRSFLTSILVRTRTRSDASRTMAKAIASVEPELPVATLRPMKEVVKEALARPRFYAFLTGSFAIFALILTAIGLYSFLSYQLSLRTREIAIRVSLGAQRTNVVMLIVIQGMLLVVRGIIPGAIAAVLMRHVAQSMVYNLADINARVIAAAIVLLGLVAALASLITATRAASIEPMTILRND